ncbi:hypothetical protein [Natronobiforma cellulositropha]|uniref:hypothetical protein n=1 Tax=Natronobiforma cellulositropha TaxID=1679076 RepID=UPI003CCCE2E6
MKAVITGENAERIGVNLLDNNDVEHVIEMEFDGAIKFHSCEEYPNNPAKRTRTQTEYGEQARRYAQWHVYRERGYDTVPSTENPDRILAALLALTRLSSASFEASFGDLEKQLRSHYDGSKVELPFADADPDGAIVYRQDLYLEPNPLEFDPPVLEQFRAHFDGPLDSSLFTQAGDLTDDDLDALEFDLEAVSGLGYLYNDGRGSQQTIPTDQPLERAPDARIELLAFDPEEVDSFQHYLVSHLAYQIRDRFLLMGLTPPAAFQAQGWGTYDGFQAQTFCDLYEEYWSPEATITSWDPF